MCAWVFANQIPPKFMSCLYILFEAISNKNKSPHGSLILWNNCFRMSLKSTIPVCNVCFLLKLCSFIQSWDNHEDIFEVQSFSRASENIMQLFLPTEHVCPWPNWFWNVQSLECPFKMRSNSQLKYCSSDYLREVQECCHSFNWVVSHDK